ncbi:MAG TPA: hypothetical protein VN328_06170, partial [Thermodesulfovibrionales bacterium]|nr:hypothetical protein [Thermodesulfovibrionales bacterium]
TFRSTSVPASLYSLSLVRLLTITSISGEMSALLTFGRSGPRLITEVHRNMQYLLKRIASLPARSVSPD